MCGIAGVAGDATSVTTRERLVARMNVVQRRRGPDDEGIHSWPHATLAHRRLAIFDLSSAGHQPMLSEDGNIGGVFNGAIYNFRALRAELETEGYRFVSRSDTEVLLHGYHRWGIDALVRRLCGMFALAIYDARDDCLWLVRDRLGVKPLVYRQLGDALWFASTTRALRAAGAVGEIDAQALLAVLRSGYLTDDECIYVGARKLPAASILKWQRGTLSISRYWSALEQPAQRVTFKEAVEETERLLIAAVARRLAADVPVATLLSAGIDSGLVSWASAQAGATVTAFTVGVPADPSDEAAAAARTAQRIGLSHQVLPMSAPQFEDLEEVVAAYSEPFAIESSLGLLRVSRLIRDEATVVLTGEGGDDVFLGYDRHRHLYLATELRRLWPVRAQAWWLRVGKHWPRVGRLRRLGALLDYAAGGLAAYRAALDRSHQLHDHGVLGARLLQQLASERAEHQRDAARRRPSDDILRDYLAFAQDTQFVGEYLPKVDGATMHHGLEARSPLLDQELWAFATGLPYNVRLRHGRSKAVLRAIARRRLGADIATRKKQGFRVPVQRWMAHSWHGHIHETIASSRLARDGWVQRHAWARAHANCSVAQPPALTLWHLLMLEKWYRHEQEAFSGGAMFDEETARSA
ncbi:MAG TPA: asparagine synthase (glutamine-hydrolyzing) [Sorangium sp.]|nr:asparagine synthase (glutamine-hydrolyzing) [Sorangium sp.]